MTETFETRDRRKPRNQAVRGWIFYDARCPICTRAARRCGGIAQRRGFRLMPMQRAWVRDRMAQEPQPLADEIRVLLRDDQLLGGVDALLHVGRQIWWAAPFAWVGSWPGIHGGLRWLYARVARNRFAISRACGLDTCGVGRPDQQPGEKTHA